MATAKKGDRVRVSYTGRFPDGTVFDSSDDCSGGNDSGPLEFVIGEQEVIPGFENGVIGMAPGDVKTVNIPEEDAYGPHNPDLVAQIARKDLPEGMNPEPGQQLEVTQEDGNSFMVVVTEATDETVTLDANHPLAGRELVFDLKLEQIL